MSAEQFIAAEYKTQEELDDMGAHFISRTPTDDNGYFMSYYSLGKDIFCTIKKQRI
jgi:hypothetical protein